MVKETYRQPMGVMSVYLPCAADNKSGSLVTLSATAAAGYSSSCNVLFISYHMSQHSQQKHYIFGKCEHE
jgi:hypothetical protein